MAARAAFSPVSGYPRMPNRKAMADVILTGMGLTAAETLTTVHNYIVLRYDCFFLTGIHTSYCAFWGSGFR